ncbi:unnamed protein product [Closterium sp. NIES-53]
MASLCVLAFDHEGRPIQFDTWLDNLQLYLSSESRDSVSLFDHTSGNAPAPPATADSATRSQWLTRDAAACLAIRNHLPLADCALFGQQRTTQALYNAVVARYSSPATAALGRLLQPYQGCLPLPQTQPPMFITLYFIVTRLPDSLRSVRDHFLSLDPTSLTVDLLEQHLLVAQTSAVAVGASRGTPRTPFFEGCSPSPLTPSYASSAAVDVLGAEDVGAASASAKRRSSRGKGGRGGRFYHPTSRRVFPSQDVTFDESEPFYRLVPYRSAPPPPLPLFFALGPPPSDPLPPQGAARGAASRGAASWGAELGGAGPGDTESEGARSGGAEPEGVEPGGAKREGVESGGAESEGAEFGGAEPQVTASAGGPAGAFPRLSPRPKPLSPQQLPEWFAQRTRLWSGAAGARDTATGDTGAGGAAAAGPGGARTRGTGAAETGSVGGAGAGDPTEPGATEDGGTGVGGAGAGGAGAVGTGARGTGAGGVGARGAGALGSRVGGIGTGGAGARGARAVDPGAGGAGAGGAVSGGTQAGGTVRPRPYFVPLLKEVLGVPSSTGITPPLLCPSPDQSQPPLQPASPLPTPSPYTEKTGGLTEHCELASCPASRVCTGHRAPGLRPPPVPGTHAMELRPSSVPLRVPVPPPPESSLPEVPDPESDGARAAGPTVPRLPTTVVTDPSFESTAASALIAELLDFAAAYRLDYATILIAESDSSSPPSVGGECGLRTDVLSVLQLLHLVLLPCCLPLRETRMHQTSRPRALTKRRLRYSFLAGHEEIWLRRPPGFTRSFPAGTQRSLRPPVYGLRQAPREWHDTLRTTLEALGFAPSTADTSLFLRTYTSLLPFYVLVYIHNLVFATTMTEAVTLITQDRARRTITLTQSHMEHQVLQRFGFQFLSPQPTPLSTAHSLSALPLNESIKASGPYPELVGCLMYLMTCTRPDLAYPLSLLSRSVAPGRHRKLSCEAEIYTGAMAAQELRWLTYVLTDLGEQPHSPPVLYVDNKAMIALCQEHRTKNIALRYFLARELQQRGQLCLAYVATRAKIADIFTKALLPGDHQRFSTVLGLVPTLPQLLTT